MVEEENSQLQRVASKVLGNNVTVVLGSQWGDEGKGKLVDILCDSVDVCARCQGGNNAGHTIVADKIKYDFHILPSGLLSPSCLNLVGSGCVVNIPSFFEEINKMKEKGLNFDGRLFISDRVHLVFAYHEKADALKEQELGLKSIGTTGKGIGPCYSNKASRSGVRMHHLINDWPEFERRYRINLATRFKRYGDFEYDCDAEIEAYRRYAIKIKPYVTDAIDFLHSKLESKKKILVEGANALMLDLDFGTYPFVTSSNTTIGGAMTGLGISPKHIDSIIGVLKAYTTRVGQGPFPTELYDAPGELLQQRGKEWGVTTGRKRRCGWLDLVQAKFSCRVNGYTSIMLTKLDVLDSFEEIKIGTQYKSNDTKLDSFPASSSLLERVDVVYETLPGWNCDTVGITEWKDLPKNAQAYVEYIEDYLKVPILLIGTGPSRDQIIVRDTEIKS